MVSNFARHLKDCAEADYETYESHPGYWYFDLNGTNVPVGELPPRVNRDSSLMNEGLKAHQKELTDKKKKKKLSSYDKDEKECHSLMKRKALKNVSAIEIAIGVIPFMKKMYTEMIPGADVAIENFEYKMDMFREMNAALVKKKNAEDLIQTKACKGKSINKRQKTFIGTIKNKVK